MKPRHFVPSLIALLLIASTIPAPIVVAPRSGQLMKGDSCPGLKQSCYYICPIYSPPQVIAKDKAGKQYRLLYYALQRHLEHQQVDQSTVDTNCCGCVRMFYLIAFLFGLIGMFYNFNEYFDGKVPPLLIKTAKAQAQTARASEGEEKQEKQGEVVITRVDEEPNYVEVSFLDAVNSIFGKFWYVLIIEFFLIITAIVYYVRWRIEHKRAFIEKGGAVTINEERYGLEEGRRPSEVARKRALRRRRKAKRARKRAAMLGKKAGKMAKKIKNKAGEMGAELKRQVQRPFKKKKKWLMSDENVDAFSTARLDNLGSSTPGTAYSSMMSGGSSAA